MISVPRVVQLLPRLRFCHWISGGAAGTVLYTYDEAGHLLGEYDGTGALIEETVWLGDTPVATLRPSGSGVSIYYIHSDPLNTPRQITRPSDNTPMWTWNSDPFGTDAANPNPAGAGSFTYNLRFLGQIFDGEAGLHQNVNRDYDPAVGRYVESDPIGLAGGIDTYAYVDADPLSLFDIYGLDPDRTRERKGRSRPTYPVYRNRPRDTKETEICSLNCTDRGIKECTVRQMRVTKRIYNKTPALPMFI
jgi:RHS repeat-associated protein